MDLLRLYAMIKVSILMRGTMPALRRFLSTSLLLWLCINQAHSACPSCCKQMGGIQYCDSSTGRYVCQNGYYSSCYCTRHAVMDLQRLSGCCFWQGGVLAIDPMGLVICNDGGVSEICSLQNPVKKVSIW